MNYKDIILILVFLNISIAMIVFINNNTEVATSASVYYKNDLIMTIDMTEKEQRTYTVDGTNGDVVIEVVDGKIRVFQENSPFNICSKQGYIENAHEVLICLPNDIIIKLEGNSDIDTIIR